MGKGDDAITFPRRRDVGSGVGSRGAVTERAELTPGSSTEEADADVESARYALDRLRGVRLEISRKISRWRTELSVL